MAVDDLWVSRRTGQPTARAGRGKRWRVRVEGYPGTLHRTKAEAERVELDRLRAGPPKPASSVTVGAMIDLWLASKGRLAGKSVRAAKDTAVAVRARWGDRLASSVERHEVQEWLDAETGSPSRLHKLSQCLTGAMALAEARNAIDANPCTELRLPKERPHEPIFLSPAQVGAIADNCHGWGMDRRAESRLSGWYAPLVWFLVTTGARIGEALALDVGSIVRRRVGGQWVWRARIVVSKSDRPRDVPVPGEVVAMLDLRRPAGSPLFVTPLGHRVVKDTFRARAWSKALDAAGLGDSGLRIHDLRHTAISWAIADGADIKMVQLMAGHRSAKTTMDVYSHLWEGGLDLLADLMGKRMLSYASDVPEAPG